MARACSMACRKYDDANKRVYMATLDDDGLTLFAISKKYGTVVVARIQKTILKKKTLEK